MGVPLTLKVGSQYNKTRDTLLMQHSNKRKDRLEFYPCIVGTPLDASDHTCLKFIVEFKTFILSMCGSAAACVCIVN